MTFPDLVRKFYKNKCEKSWGKNLYQPLSVGCVKIRIWKESWHNQLWALNFKVLTNKLHKVYHSIEKIFAAFDQIKSEYSWTKWNSCKDYYKKWRIV